MWKIYNEGKETSDKKQTKKNIRLHLPFFSQAQSPLNILSGFYISMFICQNTEQAGRQRPTQKKDIR